MANKKQAPETPTDAVVHVVLDGWGYLRGVYSAASAAAIACEGLPAWRVASVMVDQGMTGVRTRYPGEDAPPKPPPPALRTLVEGRGVVDDRVEQDITVAVRYLEACVQEWGGRLVWTLSRITNSVHALHPFGAGFGVEVKIYDDAPRQNPLIQVVTAWEKAGGKVSVLGAAERAVAMARKIHADRTRAT